MSSSSSSGLSKRELVELLECAKNSKERNKAVKLLKKYEPVKNFEWDAYGKKENLTHKRYEYVKAFLCPRCGVVKQTNNAFIWNFVDDKKQRQKKVICSTCYQQLTETEEIDKMRKEHQKKDLIPKGFGFGLSGKF